MGRDGAHLLASRAFLWDQLDMDIGAPIAGILYGAMTLDSAGRYWTGKISAGVMTKGQRSESFIVEYSSTISRCCQSFVLTNGRQA